MQHYRKNEVNGTSLDGPDDINIEIRDLVILSESLAEPKVWDNVTDQ